MHVGKIHTYGNITYHKEVITYFYKVKPINSLFASETQKDTLLEKFKDLILDVNMPGFFFVKPKEVNRKKILQTYAETFKENGDPEFLDLAKDYIKSIQEILSESIKYRYEIFFCFTDGRSEMKRRKKISVFPVSNDALGKDELSLYQIAEEEIFKKMSKHIDTTKVNEEIEIEKLMNYLAVPTEKSIDDYWVTEHSSMLEYEIVPTKGNENQKLYTTTLVASKFNRLAVNDVADDVINGLQLGAYPTDVMVKFDLVHTKQFIKNMTAKNESIKKAQKRYISLTDRKDKEAIKGTILSKSAMELDESIEQSKVRWQLYFRIRSNDEKMLEKRRESLRSKFKSSRIELSVEIGKQITLANNLFPYRNEFKRYIQSTDIAYLARYNFLGGIYIGEEDTGIIETFTRPGDLPVLYDTRKILEGKAKTNAPTTVYCGETGGGKTQMCDHKVFVGVIFYARRSLTIDPKGDRIKKIEMLGDKASHLIIGAEDNPDGMLDAFLMNSDNSRKALAEAKANIDALVTAHDRKGNVVIPYHNINSAFDDMTKDVETGKQKQMTFTSLLEHLKAYDEDVANLVLSTRRDPIARLFFANQDTKIDKAFNLNKRYNLVTFAEVPLYDMNGNVMKFNPNHQRQAIFAICMSKVTGIINSFARSYPDEDKEVTFDEYKVWKSVPGGENVVINTVMTARSLRCFVNVISQQFSDINSEILNNTGQIYVGSLKSQKEIEYVLEEMKLENHNIVRNALIDRTQIEGADESKKYVFLFQDYNNRKSLAKLIMPRTFKEAFKTLKDRNGTNIHKSESEATENDVLSPNEDKSIWAQ